MRDFTAAHPSLPLGTFVKVTNLKNGKAVVVRINDRGPVVDGRIIDVSYNAALALGFKERGVQKVRLELYQSANNRPTNRGQQLPANDSGAAATRSQAQLNPIHSGTIVRVWTRASVSSLPWMYLRPRPPGRSWRPSATPPHAYKVGMQLYTAEGPAIVRELVGSRHRVFLDLKYHDIPNTVGAAVREAAQLGVSMLTVHASGGGKMLRAAVDAAQAANPDLLVLAVTVLTSLDDDDLGKIGLRGGVLDQVLRLAALALSNGCKGVVASAQEAAALREEFGHDFAIVTPGVRPAGSGQDDQARVVTPAEAIAAGASHIVVGRPITEASDPAAEARAILGQIG